MATKYWIFATLRRTDSLNALLMERISRELPGNTHDEDQHLEEARRLLQFTVFEQHKESLGHTMQALGIDKMPSIEKKRAKLLGDIIGMDKIVYSGIVLQEFIW
jgi:hypothetical protein